MATEFLRKTMADVVTTALPNTSNTNSDLYTVPANCDTVIIGLLLTNKSGASVVADVMIEVQSGQGEDVYLVKGAQVPVGSALEVISGKVVVANTGGGTGDTLQVRCDTASALDATVSILENT
jgi:hypothetical protein|tara:strand:+ start:174 stop:542 length:369 start_codon:yes stop_codon:yes gene_type:complete